MSQWKSSCAGLGELVVLATIARGRPMGPYPLRLHGQGGSSHLRARLYPVLTPQTGACDGFWPLATSVTGRSLAAGTYRLRDRGERPVWPDGGKLEVGSQSVRITRSRNRNAKMMVARRHFGVTANPDGQPASTPSTGFVFRRCQIAPARGCAKVEGRFTSFWESVLPRCS